jgi:hypothetical protein
MSTASKRSNGRCTAAPTSTYFVGVSWRPPELETALIHGIRARAILYWPLSRLGDKCHWPASKQADRPFFSDRPAGTLDLFTLDVRSAQEGGCANDVPTGVE